MALNAPPPPLTEEQRSLRRRRRRLLSYTLFLLLLALAGAGVWGYYAYLPYRATERIREGAALMSPGHYQEAVDKFNEALQIDPERRDVFGRRGLAYQNLGQMDLALDDYERALLADSHQPAVITARGIIYRSRGEFQKAVTEFTKALSLEENTDTYWERAQTYELLEDNQKAVEDLNKVVAALRDAPHVLRARASVKLKLGDREGYEADLASAHEFEDRAHKELSK